MQHEIFFSLSEEIKTQKMNTQQLKETKIDKEMREKG